MRQLIIALFLCLILVAPAGSKDNNEKPFLAVFCQPEFARDWKEEKPDLIMPSRNWQDFKLFISEIKRLSKEREVIIDIDSHGTESGQFLWLDDLSDVAWGKETTFGYVLNQVDRLPRGKVKFVLSEACFAGVVYHNSLHCPQQVEFKGNILEPYQGERPDYPVYGVKRISNWNNSVYAQYTLDEKVDFHDIRNFDLEDPGSPVSDSDLEKALKYFYAFYHASELLEDLTKN